MAAFQDFVEVDGTEVDTLETGNITGGGANTVMVAGSFCQYGSGVETSAVTWNVPTPQSLSMVTGSDFTSPDGYVEMECWARDDPTSATDTVTADYDSDGQEVYLGVCTYTSADTTSDGANDDSGDVMSITVANMAAGDIAFCMYGCGSTGENPTLGTGVNERGYIDTIGPYSGGGIFDRSDNGTIEITVGDSGYGSYASVCRISNAGTPVTVSPGAGQVVIAGFNPSITALLARGVSPGAAQTVITGFTPTISALLARTAAPGAGQAVITGFTPTITALLARTAAPGFAQLSITGFLPVLTTASGEKTIDPGVAQLSIAGFKPTVSRILEITVAPGAAQLIITGLTPTVSTFDGIVTVEPGAAQLTIAGFNPTLTQVLLHTVSPGVAALVIEGFKPTLDALLARGVSPGVAQLVIEAFTPTIRSDNARIEVGTAQLTITGFKPTLTQVLNITISPGAAQLSIVGHEPTLRLHKWTNPADPSGNWTEKADVSGVWTEKTDTSGSWS